MAGAMLLAAWAATAFLASCMAARLLVGEEDGSVVRCAVLLVASVAALAVEAAIGLLLSSSLLLIG